ncbi:MAG TPA: nucleotidyltransferase [Methanosarcinales archaeon]|nr:nucleotidyltransferase [Methanosarcinales archaeon]
MIAEQVKFDLDRVSEYCRQHNIRRLAVFGSAVHGDMRPDSDLDLLIEFKSPVGLFAMVEMEDEMKNLFPSVPKVDLVTKNSLSKYFRDEVIKEAEVVYAE